MFLATRITLAALVALAVAILSPPARAQTEGEGTAADKLQVLHRVQGAFDVAVAVQPGEPVVGPVHIVVTVLDVETRLPVDRAAVVITATSPGGDAIEVRGVSTPQSRGEYRANLSFKSAGEWVLTVDLEREGMGSATVDAPLVVGGRPLPAGRVGTLVWFLVLAALFGGALYVWRRSRAATAGG